MLEPVRLTEYLRDTRESEYKKNFQVPAGRNHSNLSRRKRFSEVGGWVGGSAGGLPGPLMPPPPSPHGPLSHDPTGVDPTHTATEDRG